MAYSDRTYVGLQLMAYSDRTYVGPGPEWVTVYYVEHFTLHLVWELKRVLYFGVVSVLVATSRKQRD